MEIKNAGYNVGDITIDTAIPLDTKTEIGDTKDFNRVASLADAGGVCRVHATVAGNSMNGLCLLTHVIDKIDLGSVTNFEGTPYVIAGTVSLETGKMYITMSMNAVSAGNSKTATKASK